MKTRKCVELELECIGDGRIIERPRGVFRGGVPGPEVSPHFGFNVLPEIDPAT